MTDIIAAAEQVEPLRAAFPEAAVVSAMSAGPLTGPAVVWLEALGHDEIAHLERLFGDEDHGSIAVYAGRWDGFTAVPLAGYVRGVIGGFGHDGVHAALRVIESGR